MNALSQKRSKSEVVVVGASPFGWACAHLLSRKKIRTILVDDQPVSAPMSWQSKGLGVFWPSLNDPPTRAVVAHGLEMAQWLQRVCVEGLGMAQSLIQHSEFLTARTLRIGLEKHEVTELNVAQEARLGITSHVDLGTGYFSESENALILKHPALPLKANEKSAFMTTQAHVVDVIESKDGCTVIFANGEQLQCEIVILANGFRMTALQPWLAPMLVPMSDVQSEWKTNVRAKKDSAPWAIRTASGHVAAVVTAKQTDAAEHCWHLKLTGPRFFLPQAGAGIDLSPTSPDELLQSKIASWLRETFIPALLPLFALESDGLHVPTQNQPLTIHCENIRFGVDCLPCDELPIVGELGLQGRILGSTGWLGCGWSAGLQAAKFVVDLVEQGRSMGLPSLMQPKRWRSGMNDGVTGMT